MRTNIINAYVSLFMERVDCYEVETASKLVDCSQTLMFLMTEEEWKEACAIRDAAIAIMGKGKLINE